MSGLTDDLDWDFYLAACDEATRSFNGYHSVIFARFYAYMMGSEL